MTTAHRDLFRRTSRWLCGYETIDVTPVTPRIGVDRILPPGEYKVVTDERLIEELSSSVYRRVATMIFVPGHPPDTTQRDGCRPAFEEMPDDSWKTM